MDSSESSGESVSGLSSCSHGYHSAVPGEVEDTSSVCSSIITVKEARQAPPDSHEPNAPAASPDNAPSRGQTNPENESKNLPCSKVHLKSAKEVACSSRLKDRLLIYVFRFDFSCHIGVLCHSYQSSTLYIKLLIFK